ncbi:MAG: class I SAM-dependent methyltransferase [Omnitrophica WOR_2 bacterium]
MDLHDFTDVAENYDLYVPELAGSHEASKVLFHTGLAQEYGVVNGILDIACGTGATLIPLIQQGYTVTGLDLSSAMLAVLERKLAALPEETRQRARLVCADMTDFQLGEAYSLAIIPGSGFMHLLSPEDQEQALRTIYNHLIPGGIFSFNSFDPNYGLIAANLKGSYPQPQIRTEYTNASGRRERIWNQMEYDPSNQVMEGSWIFEELSDQGEVIEKRTRPLRMRWSFEPELRHLLRLCGFEILNIYGSYAKEPRRYGGGIVWVARKV